MLAYILTVNVSLRIYQYRVHLHSFLLFPVSPFCLPFSWADIILIDSDNDKVNKFVSNSAPRCDQTIRLEATSLQGKTSPLFLSTWVPAPSLRPLPSYVYLCVCVWACVSLRRMPVYICSDFSSCLGPVLAVCRVSCLLRIVSRIAYP